eukprot:TRINITY_DN1089_c0_g1_i4.p1 TRINITY_DN1089_c0_g1~~TRINITY_DN1089_c0_g1_i4.p1  ORF type:complete len:147 (+),score=17.15 TRINITY_DN1089_c0_g1_i4:53-493(+)
MNSIVFFVIATLVSVAMSDPFKWSVCTSDAYPFSVSSVAMDPYPAVAGKNVTIHASGTGATSVSGGSWSMVVKLLGIPVQSYTGLTCSLAPTCPCPCPPGSYTISISIAVPSFSPPGSYTAETIVKDQTGQQLSCIDATFDISSSK